MVCFMRQKKKSSTVVKMASTAKASNANTKSNKPLTKEQIAQEFNELRNQQKQLVSKISEIENEKKEYQYVGIPQ